MWVHVVTKLVVSGTQCRSTEISLLQTELVTLAPLSEVCK